MEPNYTKNELVYKKELKAKTPAGDNIEVVGGLWKDPVITVNKNEIKAEIAFKNADTNMVWSPLRSYNFDKEEELDREMDFIVTKIKEGTFDESGK